MTRLLILPLIGAAFTASAAYAEGDATMNHQGHEQAAADKCALPMGEGVINTIDVKNAKLSLTQKPIAMLGWDAKTADYKVASVVDLAAFYQGEQVHFMLKPEGDNWAVAMMCSLEADADAHAACMTAMGEEQAKIAAERDKTCVSAAPADANQHHGHH
ncbi:MAG: copper-binding protein [Parvularculaceae bacterium]